MLVGVRVTHRPLCATGTGKGEVSRSAGSLEGEATLIRPARAEELFHHGLLGGSAASGGYSPLPGTTIVEVCVRAEANAAGVAKASRPMVVVDSIESASRQSCSPMTKSAACRERGSGEAGDVVSKWFCWSSGWMPLLGILRLPALGGPRPSPTARPSPDTRACSRPGCSGATCAGISWGGSMVRGEDRSEDSR